jgi:hypothetical protein
VRGDSTCCRSLASVRLAENVFLVGDRLADERGPEGVVKIRLQPERRGDGAHIVANLLDTGRNVRLHLGAAFDLGGTADIVPAFPEEQHQGVVDPVNFLANVRHGGAVGRQSCHFCVSGSSFKLRRCSINLQAE